MKPAIGAAILAALAVGGIAVATSRPAQIQAAPPAAVATQPALVPEAQPISPATVAGATPAPERVVVRERVVYRDAPAPRTPAKAKPKTRSTKKSVAIIGGSAAAGAVVGGLIDGKKGAVIGAVVGGAGGTVYDRKTRKKDEKKDDQ